MRSILLPMVVVCLVAGVAAPAPLAAYHAVPPGASIQAAIDAAVAAGEGEVRVAAGTFTERLQVPEAALDALRISGGWDAAFASQPAGAETIVDAAGGGRPLTIVCNSGLVTVSRLTFTGGLSSPPEVAGGGVQVVAADRCRVVLQRLRVSDNRIEKLVPDGHPFLAPLGCGIYVDARDQSAFELRDSQVLGNACDNRANGAARGGGLDLNLAGLATAVVDGNELSDNSVAANDQANTAGFQVSLHDGGAVELTDNVVRGNRLLRADSRLLSGGSVTLETCTGCRAELRRNQVIDNWGDVGFQSQLRGIAQGGTLVVSDSIFAGGEGSGAHFDAQQGATLQLTNLTVADNAEVGLACGRDATSSCRLSNSIVFGNGSDVVAIDEDDLDPGSNLLGVDPRFVDRAARDYRLRLSSRAVDGGNDAPLGGLGTLDVVGSRRIQGRHVDVGAHEATGGGGSAGGICRATDLGVPNPAPSGTHACDCFSEPLLRSYRCSFLLRDGFIWVRIPMPAPFSPFAGDWSILPWSGFEGPYALAAQVLVKGTWQPLPVGNNGQVLAQGKLVDGKIEKGRLTGEVTAEPADLRLLVKLPGDGKLPHTWELEFLLPVATPQP